MLHQSYTSYVIDYQFKSSVHYHGIIVLKVVTCLFISHTINMTYYTDLLTSGALIQKVTAIINNIQVIYLQINITLQLSILVSASVGGIKGATGPM